MRISKYLPLILLIVAFVLLSADNSFATTTSFEQISDKFQDVGNQYLNSLKDYAFGIFKIFILIDIGIFGVRAALNRSEIGEILSQFIMMLLFATFCAVAIKYYGEWTGFLLDKSKTIAAAVGGGNVELTPINTGFDILTKVINASPAGFSPSAAMQSLGYLILGGVIMVCFCLMSARMLVILCESYIAMAAAVLLLGFGGSSMTKDYAINAMRYAVSVAFKLFVIRLVMGVGLKLINDLGVFNQIDLQGMFMILAAAVVLLVLVGSLPETVAGIINGSHVGGGVGLGSVARTAGAVATGAFAGAAAAATGMGQAGLTVSRAQKIASMEGSGGIGGTASQLWNSFKAARQQDSQMGGLGSTLRRMHADTNDMYHARQAMNNPDYQANPYTVKNPYMSPLSNLSQNAAANNASPGASPEGKQPDNSSS
jgi:type IV secretion system protein TrbL